MIFGIGTDIVQVSRIAAVIARSGTRFAEKILGADELQEYQQRSARVAANGLRYLCKRYAAKEAYSKALGLGMRPPMSWHDLQILNVAYGAPQCVATGLLDDYMQHRQLSAKISLSDEIDYAVAFVLLEQNQRDVAS